MQLGKITINVGNHQYIAFNSKSLDKYLLDYYYYYYYYYYY